MGEGAGRGAGAAERRCESLLPRVQRAAIDAPRCASRRDSERTSHYISEESRCPFGRRLGREEQHAGLQLQGVAALSTRASGSDQKQRGESHKAP